MVIGSITSVVLGPITNVDNQLCLPQVANHKKPRLEDSLGRRMEAGPGQEVEGAGDSHGQQIDIVLY